MDTFSSNFQRSQSKVWWGNDNILDRTYQNTTHSIYSKLGKISVIPEITNVMPTIISPVSAELTTNQLDAPPAAGGGRSDDGSPGSLKSHDSGFDDSTNNKSNNQSHSPQSITNSAKSTPPTVIRKKCQNDNSSCSSSFLTVQRRISFTEEENSSEQNANATNLLFDKIDKLNYNSISPLEKNSKDKSLRRRKIITIRSPKVNRKLLLLTANTTDTKNNEINSYLEVNSEQQTVIQNESIPIRSILKSPSPHKEYVNDIYSNHLNSNNDENYLNKNTSTPILVVNNNIKTLTFSPLLKSSSTATYTSSPSSSPINSINYIFDDDQQFDLSASFNWETYTYNEYTNPLLNGHSTSVHFWLDEIRSSYCHEVLSTLQTKSIAVEANRYYQLNSFTATKIIRQLQIKVIVLQTDFEKIEKYFDNNRSVPLLNNNEEIRHQRINDISNLISILCNNIFDFINKLKTKYLYYIENNRRSKMFKTNIDNIISMSNDLLKSIENNFENMKFDMIYDDILILKRYVLIQIRIIFENLMKIIINRIEETDCNLLLKSNLSMLSMLTNMNHVGFASLTDAFLSTETIRILLLICLDVKTSSIRCLALRSLATICSTVEALRQFEQFDGVDILKEIIARIIDGQEQQQQQQQPTHKRRSQSEYELREAISVLTQITAPWHNDYHQQLTIVDSLKKYIEYFVAKITSIIEITTDNQILLLCAACLNNLSKIEKTTIYSLMSNNTILILKLACNRRERHFNNSIFLYEQIVNMLLNMAENKKCHNHMANTKIINFITTIFETQFYEKFKTRAENESHCKTIKNILYIFTRLIQEPIVGQEILENNVIPIFSNLQKNMQQNNKYYNELSSMNQKLNDSINGHRKKTYAISNLANDSINNNESSNNNINNNNYRYNNGNYNIVRSKHCVDRKQETFL